MPKRKATRLMFAPEDSEKVARIGFGLTDEDFAATAADTEFQEALRKAREAARRHQGGAGDADGEDQADEGDDEA